MMQSAYKARFEGDRSDIQYKHADEQANGPSEDEWAPWQPDPIASGDEITGDHQAPALCEAYKTRGYCLEVTCKRSHTKAATDDLPIRKAQYSPGELRTIGQICSGGLPPASTVQAMFMYELQREAENEKLFDSLLFRLARGEDATNTTADRLVAVEKDIKALKLQTDASNVQQKLATSLTRHQQQAAKLESCKKQLDTHDQRFEQLMNQLKTAEAVQERIDGHDAHFKQLAESMKALGEKPSAVADAENDNELMNAAMIAVHKHEKDLDLIFDERDALVEQLEASNTRISKLEDLVRALTANMSPTNSTSPTMIQQLPVQMANGQTVNLSIPKGTSLGNANAKENRAPAAIRAFTPGKQWAA